MRPPGEQIGGNIPGPTYVCQVCGQAFWGTERDILMLLPGHLESNPCKQARRRARWRAWLSTVTTRLRELVFGRTVDHVISVPMDPVELTTPGPTDLVTPRPGPIVNAPSAPPPLQPPIITPQSMYDGFQRWRRVSFERWQAAFDEQIALARRDGLVPAGPIDHASLRKWSFCQVAWTEEGGERRAHGVESVTVQMKTR